MTRVRQTRLAFALVMLAAFAAGTATAAAELNPDADEILRSMSTYLGGSKAFSVAAEISNEVITRDGQKLQLNSSATLLMQRPAGLRITRRGSLADVELVFDGQRVSLFGKALNAYVQREAGGNNDQLLAAVADEIGVDLPASDLLVADPYAALSPGVVRSGYHGTAFVQGVECHHLSFREDDVDWQLWVATGDRPLPMKYVITTKWLTGAPQYSVEMHDWNVAPAIGADSFRFAPPAGAAKLERLPVDETGELTQGEEDER
jgi:hypothetical protein